MSTTAILLLLGAILNFEGNYAENIVHQVKEDITEYELICKNASLKVNFHNIRINEIQREFLSSPLIKCLVFQNNGINTIELNAFDSLPNLTFLELSNNDVNINNLFSNRFEKLEILILNNNNNYYCNNDFYIIRTYPSIRKIFLKNNCLHTIRVEAMNAFPSLTHLDLSENNYREDNFDWLPNTLEYLNLSNNNLESITLKNLPNLKQLFITRLSDSLTKIHLENLTSLKYFDYSSLNTPFLREIHFDNLFSLESLDISYHNLNSVTLKNIPNLKYVSIQNRFENNPLAGIYFENLKNLEYLSLRSNRINEISYSTFVNISSVTSVDISSNNIRFIEINAFDGMSNLEFLNLSNNEIEIIQSGTFDKLTSLETLILEKNIITIFPPFSSETQLETLNLNCNKIKRIIGGNFADMYNLKSLYLHDNEITFIDPNAFINLINLKLLTLSNNKISALPDTWMSELHNLEELDLKGNNIKEFGNLALRESSILKNIYLSNQIKIIHVEEMLRMPKNLTLNFDENFNFTENCIKNEIEYSRQHYG